MDLADIVVVFEGSYSDFTTSYSAPAYQAQFQSSHFASIVYSVFSSSEVDAAVALSKQRNMGHIYLTGSDYSSLPPLIYRQAGMILSSCASSIGCFITEYYCRSAFFLRGGGAHRAL